MTKKITKKNIVIKDKKTTSKKPATKSSSKKSKVVIKTKKNIKTTKPVVKAKSKTVKKPVPVVSKTKKVVAKASVKKTAVKVPTKKTKTTKKPVAPFSKTKKTVVKAKSKTVKKPVPVVSKTKKTFEEIFKSATKTIAKKAKAPIPVALPKAKTKVDKKLIAKSKKNIDKDEHNKTINDADLENKLTKIFNTKINKKQSGEVQIRLSTLLKETGNFLFTDDQIKHISKTLHDNNISVSGRCDKYNSPLSTYLTEHNVKTKSSNDNSNSNSIIKRMFKTLAASKPLSEDDEKKYIKMLGSKNELIRKNGREQLIISNLRLVASIARKHINKGVQLEDLILEGYLGLIKTVDRFDFNATTKFSTYATWWIRQAITRTISDYGKSIRTPIHISEQLNRIRLAEEHLTNEIGSRPSIKRISEYLGGEKAGFSEIKIIELKRISATPISLEKELKDDEESHISDFIKDDEITPLQTIEQDEREDNVVRFLKQELDSEEYLVFSLRFGIGKENGRQQLSLDEISKKLKFTKDKIRTIESRGWRKLRNSPKLGIMKKFLTYSQEENNE